MCTTDEPRVTIVLSTMLLSPSVLLPWSFPTE